MYDKIGWIDGTEDKRTPLSAENLNHMDDGIKRNSDDIDALKAKGDIYILTAAPAQSLGKDGDIAIVIVEA